MFPSCKHHGAPFLAVAALALLAAPASAQTPGAPYATIDRNAVGYAGPGRDTAHDLSGSEIRIGLLAPLSGPRRAEGQALVRVAKLALEDEATNPLPNGERLVLDARDENGLWGRAASEVARLVIDGRAMALITSADGVSAHLAEQVANKIGVPVLTLSTDETTTQINLPWIFRLGPTDLGQARAFATDIYLQRRLTKVVLVTGLDHDARVGGEEFEKVAKELSPKTLPVSVTLDAPLPNVPAVVQQIVGLRPEALVFWTDPETASKLVAPIRASLPSLPIYLCRKAAQGRVEGATRQACHSCPEEAGGIWSVIADSPQSAVRASFEQRYRERIGSVPSLASAQAYDAVRIIAAALRRVGSNRVRLRDALAETRIFPGASGLISFDHAGNDLSGVRLVSLR